MKNCPICNNIFIPKRSKQIFCSQTCSTVHARSKITPRKKSGKIFVCTNCKKEFSVSLWRTKKYNVKYCSKSCMGKHFLPTFSKIFGFKKGHQFGFKKELENKKTKYYKRKYYKRKYYKRIYVDGVRYFTHRYEMEKFIGRKLEKWEDVHHINGNHLDNRIENLQVLSHSEHMRLERLKCNIYKKSI